MFCVIFQKEKFALGIDTCTVGAFKREQEVRGDPFSLNSVDDPGDPRHGVPTLSLEDMPHVKLRLNKLGIGRKRQDTIR